MEILGNLEEIIIPVRGFAAIYDLREMPWCAIIYQSIS